MRIFSINAQNDSNTLQHVITYYDSKQYTQVIDVVNETTKKYTNFNNIKDSLTVSKLFYYKGASLYYLEKYRTSVIAYEKAIRLCPHTQEGISLKGKTMYDKAFSEYDMGARVLSYNSSKKALEILNTIKVPDYNLVLSIYSDLAAEASYFGFHKEAINYLNEAEKMYNQHSSEIVKDTGSVFEPILFNYKAITIVNNKGYYGDLEERELLHRMSKLELLKSQRRFNDREHLMYAVGLNYIGDFFLRKSENPSKQDIKKAHYYLDKALDVLDKKLYKSNYYQFQFNKSKAYALEKKHSKALSILETLISEMPENDVRLSFFYAQKAKLLFALKQVSLGIAFLKKAIGEIHNDSTPLREDFSNFHPSQILNEVGILVEVADHIVKEFPGNPEILSLAASMYHMGLVQFKNCYREQVFNKKIREYYNEAIRGILRMKHLGYGDVNMKNILNDVENIENRLIWKEFNLKRNLAASLLPDSLLFKELDIRKQLVEAKRNGENEEEIKLKNELKTHKTYLEEVYPVISDFAYKTFNVKHIQKQLSKDELILRYKDFEHELYVFGVTRDSIYQYQLDNVKAIKTNINIYYKTIINRDENKVLAHTLYQQLIPEALHVFNNIKVIPDGNISVLPFETLITEQQSYLVEHKTISYASHLVFIEKGNNLRKKNRRDIITFAPTYNDVEIDEETKGKQYRLKGAEEETKWLNTLFSVKAFESNLATKDNFIKHTIDFNVIHMAMHANINGVKPELSHFLLADNNSGNKLFLEELYGLKLSSELVVLSACNTGKEFDDEMLGMISLNRAFTFAGVPATVASLWEVPDKATKDIMVSFYENLKKGLSKSKALQNAKIEYISTIGDSNFIKPFYWAGFVLNGNPEAIIFTSQRGIKNQQILIIILGVFLLIVLISIIYIKNKANAQF